MNEWQTYNKACYIPGRPKAICDRCSFDMRHDQLKKEWTGLLVCAQCFDPRPPQLDAPNVYPEGLPIQDPRPDIENQAPGVNFLAVFNAVRNGTVESPASLPNHFPFNPFPLVADFLAVFEEYRDGDD